MVQIADWVNQDMDKHQPMELDKLVLPQAMEQQDNLVLDQQLDQDLEQDLVHTELQDK